MINSVLVIGNEFVYGLQTVLNVMRAPSNNKRYHWPSINMDNLDKLNTTPLSDLGDFTSS